MASPLAARLAIARPSPVKALNASVPLAKVLPRAPDPTLVSPFEIEPESAVDDVPQTERAPSPPDGCSDPAPPSITVTNVDPLAPVLFESAIRPRAKTIPAFFPYDPGAEPVDLPMTGLVAFVHACARALRKLLGLRSRSDLSFGLGVGPSSSQAR